MPQRLVVARQPSPMLQVSPEQQRSPDAPHVEQVLAAHASPMLHVLPAQHALPEVPHGEHVPPVHASEVRLQVLPPQQA